MQIVFINVTHQFFYMWLFTQSAMHSSKLVFWQIKIERSFIFVFITSNRYLIRSSPITVCRVHESLENSSHSNQKQPNQDHIELQQRPFQLFKVIAVPPNFYKYTFALSSLVACRLGTPDAHPSSSSQCHRSPAAAAELMAAADPTAHRQILQHGCV